MSFGIELLGLNLSDTTISYFDVVLSYNHKDARLGDSSVNITLEMCREEDWAVDEEIR